MALVWLFASGVAVDQLWSMEDHYLQALPCSPAKGPPVPACRWGTELTTTQPKLPLHLLHLRATILQQDVSIAG